MPGDTFSIPNDIAYEAYSPENYGIEIKGTVDVIEYQDFDSGKGVNLDGKHVNDKFFKTAKNNLNCPITIMSTSGGDGPYLYFEDHDQRKVTSNVTYQVYAPYYYLSYRFECDKNDEATEIYCLNQSFSIKEPINTEVKSMNRILIVDDEPDIIKLLKRYAEREGYIVSSADDGSCAVELCRSNDYDVIVMDVMMPDMDGFTACKKIREFKDIPVLMLSARGAEYDKLFGFEVGVDDYVTKPFSPKEIMARIKVIISRHSTNKPVQNKSIIKAGGIEIDTLGRNVYIDGEKTDLTVKEYGILMYLIENQGIVLSRDKILNAVWGYDYFGDDRTVDWQIKLLRNKLGKYRNAVQTIRGVGYKFEEKA